MRVAIVGLNGKGGAHLKEFQKIPGVTIAALCDVDSQVLAKRTQELAKNKLKTTTYADYRKVLENRDIDAVVIATPNHRHALMASWGLQAGKDVYVEKPVSHNVWEGRKIVEAARQDCAPRHWAFRRVKNAAPSRAVASAESGKSVASPESKG